MDRGRVPGRRLRLLRRAECHADHRYADGSHAAGQRRCPVRVLPVRWPGPGRAARRPVGGHDRHPRAVRHLRPYWWP
ncbi:hypothetical protein ACU4GD_32465 [Cupriavidus basilensis]